MVIKELRGKVTMGGPGTWAFDAEAVVEDGDKTLYIHAHWYDNFKNYTVSERSMFDFMTGATDEEPGVEWLEEYHSLRAASKSKYYAAIKAANAILNSMGYFEE